MTVIELKEKLQEIIKQGRGDLQITILTQDTNTPFFSSLVGLKSVTWGDRGGWGAEIAIIEPTPDVIIENKKEL